MELLSAFKVFDKEGNGQISKTELRHLLTNYDNKMSPENIEKLFEFLKEDENGMINYKDFLTENN